MAKAFRPLRAAEKLGEAQYVYWKPLSAEMVDVIIETKNLNKTLREILVKEKFKSTYDTIDTCIRNPMLMGNLRLFEQAVVAFNSGHNDLAVNGFTSVFDGVLSEISGKPTHKLGPRIKVIMDKLEREEVLENDEYAVMYLALTFQSAVESFSKQAPFDEPEPHNLNRHWIAHGRTRRRKTKLDCVKMINLIYGLLLVHELDNRIDS